MSNNVSAFNHTFSLNTEHMKQLINQPQEKTRIRSWDMLTFMYPCFLVGIVIKQNPDILYKLKRHYYLIAVLFLLMLALLDKDTCAKSQGIPSGILSADLQVWLTILYARLLRLLLGIIGSLATIAMTLRFKIGEQTSRITDICCEWGKYTLNIYVLQGLILERGLVENINMDDINLKIFCYVISPVLSIALIALCTLISKRIERHPSLNRILWGKH